MPVSAGFYLLYDEYVAGVTAYFIVKYKMR